MSRIEAMLQRFPVRALARLFTAAELVRCQRVTHPARSYAARFAAKEAVFKALGTGWGQRVRWTDIEVLTAPSGEPSLRLSGGALLLARERGADTFHLSLTHTEHLAGAYVILEGNGPPKSVAGL